MRHGLLGILLFTGLLMCGCGPSIQEGAKDAAQTPQGEPKATGDSASQQVKPGPHGEPLKTVAKENKVSDRPGNAKGQVLVAMFHHIGDKKDPMFLTVSQFKRDLERLDKLGFRPITATDYLTGQMNLPQGASPVVMTFDDSNPDQFQLKPDGTVDPNCMLGIWQDFAKAHPEFPIRATFFVLPDVMFGQKAMREKKVSLLKSWGCELANHTVSHPILRKLSDDAVKNEIGQAQDDLTKLGAAPQTPLALPFGASPKNRDLLKGFRWHDRDVKPTGVFLVGANPAPAPGDPRLDKTRIPRIQANEGELGLTYWLNQAEAGKVHVYVEP